MTLAGAEIPDSFKIDYNGYRLYHDRYKLLQARLNRSTGTLVMLHSDLVSKELSQKMMAANNENVDIYKNQLYVREILYDGDNERYLYIAKNVDDDNDSTYLINDKDCYIVSNTQNVLASKIVSVESVILATTIEQLDDGTVNQKYESCWKINIVSRMSTVYTTNDEARFIIEKV